jgi:hypothetical protein
VTSFAVKFLGCKVSQADAMLAREALLAAGHIEVAEADADLHVINTCCITNEAEAKSRQSVRRSLKRAREVYVAGCAVNLDAAQFGAIDDRVKPFVGTAEDVSAAVAADVGSCVDLHHEALNRRQTPSIRASEYSPAAKPPLSGRKSTASMNERGVLCWGMWRGCRDERCLTWMPFSRNVLEKGIQEATMARADDRPGLASLAPPGNPHPH